jgi:hypothetical protein
MLDVAPLVVELTFTVPKNDTDAKDDAKQRDSYGILKNNFPRVSSQCVH